MRLYRYFLYTAYVLLGLALIHGIFPLTFSGNYVEIPFHRGEALPVFAHRLKEASVIRFEKLYLSIVRLFGRDRSIKPGKYRFKTRGNELFAFWETVNQKPEPIEIEVTIPPGLRARDIARIISDRMGIDTLLIIPLITDTTFINVLAVEFPRLRGVKSLEGFLMPDTYRFEEGTDARTILSEMVSNFFRRWNEYALDTLLVNSPLNFYDVVKLASIVEKEAVKEREKPVIASVFLNRLRIGMPLQANPTIWYITGRSAYWLTKKDLKIDSPYNTYIHRGLPPTPICNPSVSSIIAVLKPARTRYLYFVADGKGGHVFSSSYRKHMENVWRLKSLKRAD